MWYECIPPFMLIAGLLSLPAYGCYFINKAALGNPYRRSMLDRWERRMYTRDYRLADHPYKSKLLESIPDK